MTPYYEQDGITIYYGDSREILPLLEPVDHVLSDPPYGRDVYLRMRSPDTHAGSGSPSRIGAGLLKMGQGSIGSIDDLMAPVAVEIGRLVRRWAVVFSDVESTYRWRQALEASGMRYVRTGAWVKPDAMPQMTGDRPGTGFEPCTIAHAQGPMRWNGGGSLAVWTHFTSKGDSRPAHPCPKPLPLMVELVGLFTDEGETILDPFGGSGTTGVAAKLSGRRCILIETLEEFCEVAANRLRQARVGRLFDAVPKAKPGKLFADEASA